jgi:precorrin-8X/cobalt-precorrin-8 methylmutase
MTAFDRWVVLDWSAAASPTTGANSIWMADTSSTDDPDQCLLDNPATRQDAAELLLERLAPNPQERVLVGIDASFALPHPAADLLVGPGAGWRQLWDTIAAAVTDGPRNANDRFAAAARLNEAAGGPPGPFWGHPPRQPHRGLPATRPAFPWPGIGEPDRQLPEYRLAERELRRLGCPVQSTWKIAYQASVGGQFLTVVGWLLSLLTAVDRCSVWPFQTGFASTPVPGEVWFAEMWPGEFTLEGHHPIRDADQVWSTARAVRAADATGDLARWMHGPARPEHRRLAVDHEGWPVSPTLADAV